VSNQTSRTWLHEWRDNGFIEPASGGERVRLWRLNLDYEALVEALIAQRPGDE